MHKLERVLALTAWCVCAPALAVDFDGTGTGPIPDPPVGFEEPCTLASQFTPLRVSFDVSGFSTPIAHVQLAIEFNPPHTNAGDLHVVLHAPGDAAQATIFGDTGGPGFGSASDLAGPYFFSDENEGDWWALSNQATIPPGGYRTSAEGASTQTLLTPPFAGLSPQQINGTWTLTVTDDCGSDSGTLSRAVLSLNAALTPVRLQEFSVN
ncbi:MAG TPA: hypothetical protein VF132_04740 [Rudaea sp.]